MKQILLLLSAFLFTVNIFSQEGTKQLMPEKDKPLYLEFNVFDGGNFGNYSATEKERIYIYLNAGETMRFGMKMNTVNYGGTVSQNPANLYFRIKNPSDNKVFPAIGAEQLMPTTGNGYISTWEQAVAGPNGVVLNGSPINGGYTPFVYKATTTGNHYIEFNKKQTYYRFALEFFDVTVTQEINGEDVVVTNPGDPNRSAGRLWSYGWQLCNTSFEQYPVKAHFYVFTEDEFVNKVNFEMIPFSFVFQANSFGITPNSTEPNYIARTQSREGDQISGKGIAEYPVFLNDPDRLVWKNTLVTPPKVQVWAEEELFMDYDYNRNPLYMPLDISSVTLKKNREDCLAEDVTVFKIESSLDGYTVILIDASGDGKYSTNNSDRVIYREIKKGLNYILWDFKTDGGGVVPYGTYNASATFLGRAPSHFPLYDVETLDGIKTSAIRPFNKLNTTIYWDDRQISEWGDPYGGTAMATTEQFQLKVENHVPRLWNYRTNWANRSHNGEINTINTWFNAIDLGYSNFDVVVEEGTFCLDGTVPWVGDVYIEGPKNTVITFDVATLNYKFFSPSNASMSAIRVKSLPSHGTLKYNGVSVSVPLEIPTSSIGNLTYTPPSAEYYGKTSFEWDARDQLGKLSRNTENIYIIINTPPEFKTTLTDQRLCTNNTGLVEFTIFDAEIDEDEIIVTAFSSDPTFVPNNGITIGGSGANRTAAITPVANKSGMAHIYLMLDDGLTKTLTEFAVYVSPSLEFTGSPFICLGDPLNLTAVEAGAIYEWKFNGDGLVKSTSRNLNQPNPGIGTWTLTVTKTVNGKTCTSSREFEVEVAPNTEFYGDFNVCVGETIYLVAEEVNASLYRWKKNGVIVGSNSQTYTKENASSSDAGTYTLDVSKYGCNNTSIATPVTVKPNPSMGMSVTGSTVDPGKNGTITLGGSETGITYNVYQGSNPTPVTNATGTGSALTITVGANNLNIGNNNFTLKASNGNCEKVLTHSANAVIFVRTPGITVSPTTLATQESGAAVTFNVKLNTEPQHNVVIAIESSNPVQGTVSTGSITLTPTNYSTGINVTVTPGRDYEVNSGVIYSIILHPATSTDLNYADIDPANVTVTNINIDVAGVTVSKTSLETTEAGPGSDSFTLVLKSKPSSNVSITLSGINTNEGSALPTSVTFTPANWNVDQLITITGEDDDIADGDITYTINFGAVSVDNNYNGISIASVSVTNVDDDVAEIITSTSSITTYEDPAKPPTEFTVKLGTKPINPVTLKVTSQNVSEGTVSPSSISFDDSNWNTPQTVSVKGVNDYVVDIDQNYTITLETSGSSEYLNVSKTINAININFNEPGIMVSKTTVATSEPGTTDSFRVKLKSKPTATVTISVVSSNTSEGTVSPTNLTFTNSNWDSDQTVTVTGGNDDIIDGQQSYTITLTAISGDVTYLNTSLVPPIIINGTNNDDDVAGLQIDKKTLTTSETGDWDEFNVKLTAKPNINVVVTISGLDITEGSLSMNQLTFTSTNWNSYQTIRVTGVNDDEQDGNQTYTLTLNCSGDPNFSSVTESITVTNADNDLAGVSITNRTLNLTEGGAVGTFIVSLNTRPAVGKTVTYNFASPFPNEITLSANSAKFTHDSWSAVPIKVTAIDDKVDDGNQSYTIAIGTPSTTDPNYNAVSAGNITVNVTNVNIANLIVTPVSGNTTEDGGIATFTVKLATKPVSPVTLTITSQNTNEGRVTGGSTLNFNSTNWNTAQIVTVTGQNDDIDDGHVEYTVLIAVGGSDTKYTSALNRTVSLINQDNDTAGVTITQITSPFQTSEAGGEAKFTIKLDSKPLNPVTITFSSSNTAEGLVSKIDDANVTGNSNTFVFNSSNWNRVIPIIITGQDDDIDDDNQQYNINVSVSSTDEKYGSSNNKIIPVTNIDNDVAGVIITKVTSPFQTTEDKGRATFTVKLATKPINSVTLNIISNNTSEGQIVAGSTITFTTTNWSAAQNVTIEGVNDNVADGDTEYTISLSASSSDLKYRGITIPNVELKNIDNDTAGLEVSKLNLITGEPDISDSFTIALKSQPLANVTISITSSEEKKGKVSATSKTLVFTSDNWSTPQSVEIIGQNDNIINVNTSYTISLLSSSISDTKYNGLGYTILAVNIDDDVAGFTITPTSGLITTEDGGTATFTVKLRSEPIGQVGLRLFSNTPTEGLVTAVSRGTVDESNNQAYITFEPSEWNSPITITVAGVNDDYFDRNKPYKIITDPANSVDGNYNGLKPSDINLTNTDNDNWGVVVSPTAIELLENGVAKTFSIALKSRPTKDVTISIASNTPSKATVDKAEVKFITESTTDWYTPKVVTVTPVNNNIADGITEVSIITSSIVSDDNDYKGFNPDDVTITIIDNDEAAILLQNLSGTATSEDGGTVTFNLVLSSEPTADVEVSIASSDTNQGTVDKSEVTFTSLDWNTPQAITVTGIDNASAGANPPYSIQFSVTSADLNYDAFTLNDISLENIDNDEAGVTVSPLSAANNRLETSEWGQNATFNVRLNTQPASDVVVNLASTNTNEGTLTKSELTFTNTNWGTPQSVSVNGIDDPNPDGDIEYQVNLTVNKAGSSDEYDEISISSVYLKNLDDTTPRPQDDSATTLDDEQSINIDVLSNDLGLDHGIKSVTIHSYPAKGSVTVNANNTITYQPIKIMGTDNRVETFEYSICTNNDKCAQAEVTVTTLWKDVTPIATDDARGTSVNEGVTIDVLFNDKNLWNGGIVVAITENPVIGSAIVNGDNSVTYTPEMDFIGQATFKYNITDAQSDVSNEATVTVTVRRVNLLPIANNDNVEVIKNTPKNIMVLENDVLGDGFYTLYILQEPEFGTASIDPIGYITYTPNTDYLGTDSFEYLLTDVDGDQSQASVAINVIEKPASKPIANPVSSATEMNIPVTIDVLYNDEGLEAGVKNIMLASQPINGEASIEKDAITGYFTVYYTPKTDWIGTEVFSYQILDNYDKSSNVAKITVLVKPTGTDHLPVAQDIEDSTRMNTPKEILVLNYVTGLEDGFGKLWIKDSPLLGSTSVTPNNTVIYTPYNGIIGNDSFKYVVEDVDGQFSMATVSMSILKYFDVTPVATDVETSVEYETATNIDVLYNDTGLDNTPITLTITTAPDVTKGSATVNTADNSVHFTPANGFSGVVTFGYTITDAANKSANATVTVNVLEDGVTIIYPVAEDFEVTTRVNKTIVIAALEHVSNLTEFGGLYIHSTPEKGNAVVNSDNTITYTPANFHNGTVTFEYRVYDSFYKVWDKGTITVHIVEHFDVTPVANDVETSVEYQTPTDINVLYNDTGLDNTPITLAITTAPNVANCTATVNTVDNSVHFIPANGFSGVVIFGYTITDDAGKFASATVTINVLKEGETITYPIAEDFEVTTRINKPVNIEAMEHVSNLTEFGGLFIHSAPAIGTAVVNGDNTITYTPSSNHIGDVTFEYRVYDNFYKVWDKGTITVHIVEFLNVTPVANDIETSVEYQTPTDINVLYNDTGLDNTPITIAITTAPNVANCTATVNTDNSVHFTPANGFSGVVTFGYTITDDAGKFASATVTVHVLEDGVTIIHPIADDFEVTTRVNTPIVIEAMEHVTKLTEFGGLFIHSAPALGTAMVNADNTITYTPSNYYEGDATFEYRVYDNFYKVWDKGTITVHVVEYFDVIPVAVDDETSVEYETSTIIDVLYNDTGLNNTPINLSITSPPYIPGCTAIVTPNNEIIFTPANGYSGFVSLEYTITDAAGKNSSAKVSITILEEGETITHPIAGDIDVTTRVNNPVTIAALDYVTNLTEFGGLFIHSLPATGTAVINSNNTITYTPSNFYIGDVTFEYRIYDDHYKVWDKATITVHVVEFFDVTPVANNVETTVKYETPTNIDVLHNDTGLDNTPIILTITTAPDVASCTATVNTDNSIHFIPANGFSGVVTFGYTITDDAGKFASATVTINVLKEGEDIVYPIANNFEVTTRVNQAIAIAALEHVDNLTEFGGLFIHSAPELGTAVVNDNNTITYTPSNHYKGDITFEYRVYDSHYKVWDKGTITVHIVEHFIEEPVANDDYISVNYQSITDIDVLYNDTNLKNTPLAVSISKLPNVSGCKAAINSNNTIRFEAANGYSGPVTMEYIVTDAAGKSASATIFITVLESGNNIIYPVANDFEVETFVNEPVIITALDHVEKLTQFGGLFIHTKPSVGTAVVNADNTITYIPSNYYEGKITFMYRVLDSKYNVWAAGTITVNIVVKPNSSPQAFDDAAATEFNTPRTIDVLSNDLGLDDIPITVTIRQEPINGTCTVEADNNITFTPSNNFVGKAQFKYTVRDFDGETDEATVTVTVLEEGLINHIPVANDDYAGVEYETPTSINVLANDTGLEDVPITVSIKEQPASGLAVANTDNSIIFTPNNEFSGIATFEYSVTDAEGENDWATVYITVLKEGEINHVPVANNDAAGTNYETEVTVNVLANDTGIEDEPIVVTIRQNPEAEKGAAVVNDDNTITFTPNIEFSGIATFTYIVTDIHGEFDWATVTISVLEDGLTNHLPIANDDFAGAEYETPTTVNVLTNDTGLEDTPISVSIKEQSANGLADVNQNDNTITFTPNREFSGIATFTYTVTDVEGDSDWATVTMTVLKEGETNYLPFAVNDSCGTSFNKTVVIDVLYNDLNLNDTPLTVTIVSKPAFGEGNAIVNVDNSIIYTPTEGFYGPARFSYRVTDAQGDWDEANVKVTVKSGTNYIPEASDDFIEIKRNSSIEVDVLANDNGLNDKPITLRIGKTPEFGNVLINENNTLTYTSDMDYVGSVTVEYLVIDADGDWDNATLTVSVIDLIDVQPIANADSCATSFNTPLSIDVLFNDENLDNSPIKVTIVSEVDENKGYTTVDENNWVKFTPKYGYIGNANFSYRVTDIDGDYSEANVKVKVKDTDNIVPIANDDKRGTSINTAVTIPVLNNDTGLDDRPIKVTLHTKPEATEGTAVLGDGNTITFTPSNGYYGIVVFKYIVTDVDGDFDTADIIITVKNGTNTVPIAIADDALVIKNRPTSIDVLANDKGLDDTPIKLQILTEPKSKEGIVAVTSDNKVLFTPYEDYLGESNFSYKVTDTDGDYSTAQVSVIVAEELTANDDYVEVDKNGSITFNVLENDIYHNINRIEFSITSYPYFGGVVANPDNTITYTPVINYDGIDSLIYKISGAHNQYAEAMVRIKIKDVGDDKLMIPEGFSPDGDGINDQFEILGLESYNNVSLIIYNRWGNMVFQSDRYKNNWDGKSNTSMSLGKTLPTGTYYYVITIKDTNKRISGNVFLKR